MSLMRDKLDKSTQPRFLFRRRFIFGNRRLIKKKSLYRKMKQTFITYLRQPIIFFYKIKMFSYIIKRRSPFLFFSRKSLIRWKIFSLYQNKQQWSFAYCLRRQIVLNINNCVVWRFHLNRFWRYRRYPLLFLQILQAKKNAKNYSKTVIRKRNFIKGRLIGRLLFFISCLFFYLNLSNDSVVSGRCVYQNLLTKPLKWQKTHINKQWHLILPRNKLLGYFKHPTRQWKKKNLALKFFNYLKISSKIRKMLIIKSYPSWLLYYRAIQKTIKFKPTPVYKQSLWKYEKFFSFLRIHKGISVYGYQHILIFEISARIILLRSGFIPYTAIVWALFRYGFIKRNYQAIVNPYDIVGLYDSVCIVISAFVKLNALAALNKENFLYHSMYSLDGINTVISKKNWLFTGFHKSPLLAEIVVVLPPNMCAYMSVFKHFTKGSVSHSYTPVSENFNKTTNLYSFYKLRLFEYLSLYTK